MNDGIDESPNWLVKELGCTSDREPRPRMQ